MGTNGDGGNTLLATLVVGGVIVYNLIFGSLGGSVKKIIYSNLESKCRKYAPIVEEATRKYKNVDPNLVMAVMKYESGCDPGEKSVDDAHGLMQLTEGTAKRFGVDLRKIKDPRENIFGGVAYLSYIKNKHCGNNIDCVLEAYFNGENAIGENRKDGKGTSTNKYKRTVRKIYNRNKSNS